MPEQLSIRYKVGKENCYREYWNGDKCIKCPCGQCQSCKDQQVSNDILKNHVTGKFCIRANLCSKCSYIRYLVRAIRHYGGAKCSRKCELCSSIYKPPLDKVLKELYSLMLFREKHKFRKISSGICSVSISLY